MVPKDPYMVPVSVMMHNGAHSSLSLEAESYRYCQLRQQLLAEIPDLDAETLADTLEGITDLNEMLAEVIRSALEDEALAEGLSTRLKDMKARLERLSDRAERKRQLALSVMREAEIQ